MNGATSPACRGRHHRIARGRATALLVAALIGSGCSSQADTTVVQHGAMRDVMRDGRIEPRVRLLDFAAPGFYGIGALAGLEGEVFLDDGTVLVARGTTTNVAVAAATDHATLLTAARVDGWRETRTTAPLDLQGLENTLAALAPGALVPGAEPIPFVVEGDAVALAMHVVRGGCIHGDPDAPPPDRFTVANGRPETVRLVGFFAPGREGVMTHHGTALHVHALTRRAPRAMGHVDALRLAAGARVRVPTACR